LLSFSEVAAKVSAERAADAENAAHVLPAKAKQFTFWEKETFAFRDFIDIVNPLQHIPIVATVYRNWTDDKIGVVPRVIGGALWGRIGGLVGGLVNAVVDWFTGKDIGDHVYAALFGNRNEATAETAVASSAGTASPPPLRNPVAGSTTSAAVADVSRAVGQSAAFLPALSAPAQSRLNAYVPEKRWDTEDGDDRRVRFTA
jgi:hypothetical protein